MWVIQARYRLFLRLLVELFQIFLSKLINCVLRISCPLFLILLDCNYAQVLMLHVLFVAYILRIILRGQLILNECLVHRVFSTVLPVSHYFVVFLPFRFLVTKISCFVLKGLISLGAMYFTRIPLIRLVVM